MIYCREKNGESEREVLECLHLRHLEGILSMENASVISLALLFLLNQSGQIVFHRPFMFPAYPHLCHQCTDRGLFPALAPLVLLRLPAKWSWGTEGMGQWCVFAPVGLLGL